MKIPKIAIIGSGSVGTTTAYALILQNIPAHIMLADIQKEHCRGEALDLSDAIPFSETTQISCGESIKSAGTADIIIIAAGARQKPGQPRSELLNTNKQVIASIINEIKPINPQAIIIIVSNPLDVLTHQVQTIAGLPRKQIFGTGTYLDSIRLRELIARHLGIAEQSVNAYVLGEHGDSQFPALSCTHIDGAPLSSFASLTPKVLDDLAQQARNKAYDIIALKGSTFFGIAACVSKMCHAILYDQKLVLPLSTYQEKYDVCLSMPCVLGKNGIEKQLELELTKDEQAKLEKSAAAIKKLG